MIELPRAQIRIFRAVLRKSVFPTNARAPCPCVLAQASKHGLTLSCQLDGVALRYHVSGILPADSIALPASLLSQIEGKDGLVRLEAITALKGKASWADGEGPHIVEFDTTLPDSLPVPAQHTSTPTRLNPPFLAALTEAAQTASKGAARLALQCILLRGKDGSVIATDGKHLLIQGGVPLPWKDDVLIPALPAFAAKEVPTEEPVLLARSANAMTVEVGPWLFRLRTEDASRYPDFRVVIPSCKEPLTRLLLDEHDADGLARALPRMPGSDHPNAPVTLDLGSKVRLLAGGDDGPEGELALSRSKAEGRSVQVVMDRRYLLRAVRLGFREVTVVRPNIPLLCRDATRTFVWMPLDGGKDTKEKKQEASQPTGPIPGPQPTNTSSAVVANGRKPPEAHPDEELPDPLTEAEALKTLFQEALGRTSRLISALRQHRRQSRAVQSAMAHLRKLGRLDP